MCYVIALVDIGPLMHLRTFQMRQSLLRVTDSIGVKTTRC